jgi:DNA (cytosine-5)-methyltransferase 1
MTSSSYVTVTDQFCGAGGSSLGASLAGAEIKLALNHWKLAVETHNTNFPNTDHDCTDISAVDPRRYPTTDILITSPECTNHSLAKGKIRRWQQQLDMFGKLDLDPSEERSRATMWDVCRFAEAHHYRIIIVENVVEARHWAPFPAWLQAMHLLGYEHQVVYLNSMFAHPTPQSRDRMYIVFWKKNLRRPNLDIRPLAHCQKCGANVSAVQSWKNPQKKWGKYGAQYRYCCPQCASEVSPYYYAALNAIDWSLPAPRIGDRARPLKEKTLKRIRIGLEKFGRQPILMDYVHTSRGSEREMVWTVDRPQRTQLGIHTHALIQPPMLIDMTRSNGIGSSVEAPYPTQTGTPLFGLAIPPFTIETQWSHAEGDRSAGIDEPLPTQTGQQGRGLVVPPFLVSTNYFRDSYTVDKPYPTQTSGNQYGVVYPPFLTSFYGTIQQSGLDQPVPTQPSLDKHALVVPPFIMSYYNRLSGQQAAIHGLDEALPTVPGRAVHYLAQPGETPDVEDCGFRMLQPHEVGRAMAFPEEYVVLGNQRQRVKQYGNAVTPPVMRMLIERCLEILN